VSATGIPALNQAKMRRHQSAFDQHGRKWSFWIDIKAGDACSPFRAEFQAPWYPDQRNIRVLQDRPGSVYIDYEEQLRGLVTARRAYRQLLIQAGAYFDPNWNIERDEPTVKMLNDIGQGPLPDAPVRAAKAGNGFILGLRPFDPNRGGDVKLAEALVKWNAVEQAVTDDMDVAEFADEQQDPADEQVTVVAEARPPRARKRVHAEASHGP